MGRRYQHDVKSVMIEFLERNSMKTILAVLALELALLLFVTYKGLGTAYLPITILFMLFTIVACGVVFYFRANQYLTIVVLILLNLGFVVQALELGERISLGSFFIKFLIAILGALLAAFCYQSLADFLSGDKAIGLMMIVQIVICMVLSLMGTGAGANITIALPFLGEGITLFEIVKVLFPFIAAGLLCKRESRNFQILNWKIKREYLFIIQMGILSVFCIVCSELGTLLVMFLTGLAMLWIFGRRKQLISILIGLFFSAFGTFWVLCDRIFLPMLVEEGETKLPSAVLKVIKRFGSALHPEQYVSDAGNQGTIGLQAITMGGSLGIETERYRVDLFAASNDFIFANLVQSCGFLMGVMVILMFFALLKCGTDIAFTCQDTYFQGLAMGITLLISIETVIHIGYNTAMFPITGIPLYFLSQGFLAVITGMSLIAVLLVISTDRARRSVV